MNFYRHATWDVLERRLYSTYEANVRYSIKSSCLRVLNHLAPCPIYSSIVNDYYHSMNWHFYRSSCDPNPENRKKYTANYIDIIDQYMNRLTLTSRSSSTEISAICRCASVRISNAFTFSCICINVKSNKISRKSPIFCRSKLNTFDSKSFFRPFSSVIWSDSWENCKKTQSNWRKYSEWNPLIFSTNGALCTWLGSVNIWSSGHSSVQQWLF